MKVRNLSGLISEVKVQYLDHYSVYTLSAAKKTLGNYYISHVVGDLNDYTECLDKITAYATDEYIESPEIIISGDIYLRFIGDEYDEYNEIQFFPFIGRDWKYDPMPHHLIQGYIITDIFPRWDDVMEGVEIICRKKKIPTQK